ncbi:MAG TPA: hypothetical protein VMT30_00235 [Candidatus Saccharimonadia bacterium]|nr:hypothetical protein [Candidatus Saccharimonadia bacterium]
MNDEELRRTVRHAAQLHGVSPQEVVAEVAGDGREPGEAERPRRRGRAHMAAWLSSLVVVGALAGGVVVGVMRLVDGPVEAQAKVLGQVQTEAAPTATPADTNVLAGLIISFTYPGMFDQVSQSKSDAQVLEQYTIGSKTNYRHRVAVEVRPLPSGQLADDASWRVREIHAADYRASAEVVGGETVKFMTKTDGHEQTLFWPHGGKNLTISITSTDPHDDISAIMALIKGSLRWKQ